MFKILIGACLIGILLLAGWMIASYHGIPGYSEGERAGYVFKLSKKGKIFKSWEGELNLAINGSENTFSREEWRFSILDESIVKQIQKAIRDGSRVALTYEEYYIKPWKTDTPYVIVKVEILDNGGTK